MFDAATGCVTSNGRTQAMPDLAQWWSPAVETCDRSAADGQRSRTGLSLKAVPDLCEMTLDANACNLGPDTPPFHAPVARIPEVANLLSQDPQQGCCGTPSPRCSSTICGAG